MPNTKPQITIYALLVTTLLVASFASQLLHRPQRETGLRANRMPLREYDGRINLELSHSEMRSLLLAEHWLNAFIAESILSALGDRCPECSVRSSEIREDIGALVVQMEWTDHLNANVRRDEVTFARESDQVYVGRFPPLEAEQTTCIMIDLNHYRPMSTEETANHPIQPSGEVGRSDVVDQPSPPADR